MIKQEAQTPEALTKIIIAGVGGGGINAINYMIASGMQGVVFMAVGSDKQELLLL